MDRESRVVFAGSYLSSVFSIGDLGAQRIRADHHLLLALLLERTEEKEMRQGEDRQNLEEQYRNEGSESDACGWTCLADTLQSNNKALAQSLQQVKQELRIALNDNARLRLEIQDLNIKLLRLENQGRARPVPLSLAAPDMSIILEQSIIVDEGQQAVHHPMDPGEETVYFNADMEFTEILPAAQSLETMEEEPDPKPESQDVEHPAEQPGLEKPSTDASAKGDAMKRSRSKPRSKAGRSKGAKSKDVETEESDTDSGQSLMGEGKKLAVAMRVGKPGDMKFAASRKEEDGSRKAIPVKPDTKARSKSKKRMEEMLKNLPTEEPKSIFDFHDKTPRHTEAKPKGPPSVFDISLDESCAGAVPSLATFREKLAVLTKGLAA
nr:hypothetical protein BaRGS_032200 [Batillaria attramentaria]